MQIAIRSFAGTFAENKDIARTLRLDHLTPALANGEEVILDFEGVTGATQSFVHALISEPIRLYGDEAFDRMLFKNCSPLVQEVIKIVCEYMQESS